MAVPATGLSHPAMCWHSRMNPRPSSAWIAPQRDAARQQSVLRGQRHWQCCRAAWQQEPSDSKSEGPLQMLQRPRLAAGSAAMGLLASAVLLAGPGRAADIVKTGTCLLGNCQLQLAECIADVQCFESLLCLQGCNGRADETDCQIRCGDLYNDQAIQTFNACAVSDKKCVPQRVDQKFKGRWYITAGLNPLFDTFDCQEHYFGVPEPGRLYGKINWRIKKRDSDFIERSVVQTFKQQENPAILYNGNNEYLHYEDTWYILDSKPDEYVVIFYIGNNDAWKGYGGATIYSRSPSLPEQYLPQFKESVKKAGLKWEDFKVTDNSCGPHPEPKGLLAKAERFAENEVRAVEGELEKDLTSFGKGFTVIEQNLFKQLTDEEKIAAEEFRRDLSDAEKYLEGIERQYGSNLPSWLNWGPFRAIFGGGSGNYGSAR
eukprot:jgi/Astpho2/9375/Aster-01644